MPDFENVPPSFSNLTGRLLSGGVAPRHVRRTIVELQEHYTDLHDDALKRGLSPQDSDEEALSRLGKEDDLIAEVLSKQELRSWASRYPCAVYGLAPTVAGCLLVVVSVLSFALGITAVEMLIEERYLPPV